MKTSILCCALLGASCLSSVLTAQIPLVEIGRTGTGGGFNNNEASGIVSYSADQTGRYLFICDDNSNIIFRYDRTAFQGAGISQNPGYTFTIPVNGNLTGSQFDLEAATLIPNIMTTLEGGASARRNYILWSGSLSMNSTPVRRGQREQLILTEIVDGVGVPTLKFPDDATQPPRTAVRSRYPSGTATLTLRDDLATWDANNGHGFGANYFGLGVGSTVLNIEGIDYDPTTRRAFLGFRAPLVGFGARYALVVPIVNILEVFGIGKFTTGVTEAPVFGTPILLDLGGRGIRDMCKGHIIGGPSAGGSGASATELPSPDNFRLFTVSGFERAYGVTKATELQPPLYVSGQNYFHPECLACEWQGAASSGGPVLIACDDGSISGSVNSRVCAFRGTFDYYTYNLFQVNYFDYLTMPDPFGASPTVKFHATTRAGVQQNLEISSDAGSTWVAAPAGVPPPNWAVPASLSTLEYSVPVSSANRLMIIRGSLTDGTGVARFQNAVAVQSDGVLTGGGVRSVLNGALVYCPETGEASAALTFFQDGNRRPGMFAGFGGPAAMANLSGGMQGDFFNWGNDNGDAMFIIGTLDAGVTTAQLQPTTGSGSPLGFCGTQFLGTSGDSHLSRRFGALGLPATAPRVGDTMWIYGDSSGDGYGSARYEYAGTQWVRTYPTPETAATQINLLSPDAGVSYVRSGRDPVTRTGFSSFWNE